MKPYKKTIRAKTTLYRKEYKVVTNLQMQDPYWNEGIFYYKMDKSKWHRKRKLLTFFEVRMYRTWKHNRKTQWKLK